MREEVEQVEGDGRCAVARLGGTPLGSEWPIVERDANQFASPMAFGVGK